MGRLTVGTSYNAERFANAGTAWAELPGDRTVTILRTAAGLSVAGLLFSAAVLTYYDRIGLLLEEPGDAVVAIEEAPPVGRIAQPVALPPAPVARILAQSDAAPLRPEPEPASRTVANVVAGPPALPAVPDRVASRPQESESDSLPEGGDALARQDLAELIRQARDASLAAIRAAARDVLDGPEALDTAESAEVAVVYEEPMHEDAQEMRPSAEALDSFVAEREAASLAAEVEPAAGTPQWQRNAVQVADIGARPMIALVLDDLGLNRRNTRRSVALPGPLTLAFMTYARRIDGMLETARANGHELMVHLPMEPGDRSFDPGPRALMVELPEAELAERLAWGLSRFEGYVGINNHMGSRFTASLDGMAQVLTEVKRRGLLYLDSRTSSGSVAAGLAERMGVPFAVRDVFIDNDRKDRAAIRRQLAKLEALARRQGFAVGIGHPHTATLEVLEDWLPEARARGIALVPISAVVRRRDELAQGAEPAG